MSEHLLQQTLPPETSVMVDYYEQGVAPPTAAEAAASRYAYAAATGASLNGDRLDDIVRGESDRLGGRRLRGCCPPRPSQLPAIADFALHPGF
jgi:hypothetical protein